MPSKFGGIPVQEPAAQVVTATSVSRFGGVPVDQPVAQSVDGLQSLQAELDQQRAATEAERASRPTLGQQAVGALETAGAIGAGIVAEPIAGLAGIGATVLGGAEEGAKTVQDVRKSFADVSAPATEEGQRQLQAVGETLAPVGEAFQAIEKGIGGAAFEATGSPEIAAFGETIPTLLGELLGGGTLKRAVTAGPTKIKNIIKFDIK